MKCLSAVALVYDDSRGADEVYDVAEASVADYSVKGWVCQST